jgi:uncharacterized membrane protein YccC
MLRSRMLLLLPLTSSIASRLQALQPAGLTPPGQAAVAALRRWLQDGAPDEAVPELRRTIETAMPVFAEAATWPDLLHANLIVRLRDLVDLQSDCASLRRHIIGAPGRPRLALPDIDGARGAGARHVDTGLALRSALAAIVAIGLGSAFWIATAWPDGSSLPVMAAVVCCFFAGADNPVPPQLGFAKWSLVAVIIGGGYVFAIMPLAHEFETLILVLAPVFLLAGVIAANPKNSIIGLAVAANLPALLALQSRYSGDFASFANGGLALIGGMWCGALVTAMGRVVQPDWMARRLLRASWGAVARAAEQRGRGDRAVFASLMLDRAGQLAPRLAAGRSWPDMMAAIRVGLNVVDLRRARHGLPPAMVAGLDAVLDGLAAEFRLRAGAERYRARCLPVDVLDRTLAAAAALPQGAARDELLLGLVGIRLSLFPDAPGYGPAPRHGLVILEHAA